MASEILNKNDEPTHSGINIEEAKRKLRDEDQFDKQLYRERIKRIHREKRLKEKEVRRSKRARTDDGVSLDDSIPQVTLGDSHDDNEVEEDSYHLE